VPNENPASLATRSEPGLSSSGGSVCNVPKVGALGEDFPALVRAHCNAVGDRPLLRIHALAALVIPFTSMALQLHHRVVVIRFQRQVAVPGNCSMRRLKRLLLVLYLLHPCSRRPSAWRHSWDKFRVARLERLLLVQLKATRRS
jgi:hypothetical protein